MLSDNIVPSQTQTIFFSPLKFCCEDSSAPDVDITKTTVFTVVYEQSFGKYDFIYADESPKLKSKARLKLCH